MSLKHERRRTRQPYPARRRTQTAPCICKAQKRTVPFPLILLHQDKNSLPLSIPMDQPLYMYKLLPQNNTPASCTNGWRLNRNPAKKQMSCYTFYTALCTLKLQTQQQHQ